MEHCISIKVDGHRCTRVHGPGGTRCTQHTRTHNRKVALYGAQPEGTCEQIVQTPNGRGWCTRVCAQGSSICQQHIAAFTRRHEREEQFRQEQMRIDTAVGVYEAMNPRPTWQTVLDDVVTHEEWPFHFKYDVAFRFYIRYANIHVPGFFGEYWRWVIHGRRGPVPQPEQLAVILHPAAPRTLGQIAADRQNVHTSVVSRQTNESLDKLLEIQSRIPSTRRYRSPDWMAAKWLIQSYGAWARVKRIVDDIYVWYNRDTCRAANDQLYKRALDGLYEKIRSLEDNEIKAELWKRVFEECDDAVGMCCEGHISRLCNVFVGFDEAFAPPVPIGELLQSRLAAISLLDISADEKKDQAVRVMDELRIPDIERSVWLDAF